MLLFLMKKFNLLFTVQRSTKIAVTINHKLSNMYFNLPRDGKLWPLVLVYYLS